MSAKNARGTMYCSKGRRMRSCYIQVYVSAKRRHKLQKVGWVCTHCNQFHPLVVVEVRK